MKEQKKKKKKEMENKMKNCSVNIFYHFDRSIQKFFSIPKKF